MITNLSLLRAAQYRLLSECVLNGNILDLGGNKREKDGYHVLIKNENNIIVTSNIDNVNYECDIVFDAEQKFPIINDSFENVVCLNVIEHIYHYKNIFSEVNRILKNRGKFIISIPFLYHLHGCPDDYVRLSDSSLKRLLVEHGFSDIEIKNIGYGPFTLFFQSIDGVLLHKIGPFRILLKNIFISVDKFFNKISKKYSNLVDRMPIGYFIIARKK